MSVDYEIVIIGSGPAGLSAAAHAASKGLSHILLERASHLNDTIFRYQKRKHVMATPEILPLRSELDFAEASREEVLESWEKAVHEKQVNVRLQAEVQKIAGTSGAFTVTLGDGTAITGGNVVLAIGLQGNFTKLRVPGGESPIVQYQLDDPDEFSGKKIVVIGTGDAGIENALALSTNNEVTVVNRTAEFARAKPANAALIGAAIKKGDLKTVTNAQPKQLDGAILTLETAEGTAQVECDLIIARIGASPPRKFLEACGVLAPTDSPSAYPKVSETYESQIPGLYVIGALAGYPLIKHCLNQGYEVIEYICGNLIPPADEPLIQGKLDGAGIAMTPSELVAAIHEKLPLFGTLTPLQIREFLISSEIHRPRTNDVVFERNDYANSLFAILEGEVAIQIDERAVLNQPDSGDFIRMQPGEFFGEMALLSGRRRTRTVLAAAPSLLLEVDRNMMNRLLSSVPEMKSVLNRAAIVRQVKVSLAPHLDEKLLAELVSSAEIVSFRPDATLIEEGTEDDAVFLILKGSVTISRRVGGRQITLAYVPAGRYVGEMAMLMRSRRTATVKATIETEAIKIEGAVFRSLLDMDPETRQSVNRELESRLRERHRTELAVKRGDTIDFLMHQGIGEATDVLLIDEALCIRCDNCEKACAETHGGMNRLNREAGPTLATLHVPTSCRHCENPHCMKDCPPDAIHRAPNGEVFIDAGQCIGCGNCERNCPYGVIQMVAPPAKKPSLLSWMLFGFGKGPGEDRSPEALAQRTGGKKAVKCDMCKDVAGGAACVRACPTGAAIRVKPDQFLDVMRRDRS